jgi:transposase
MNRLGMPTGRQTLLRQVTGAARRAICAEPIRVLGVDDWAWNKGKSFGTILVDLERSVVADLLPTRSADSLAAWLEKDPEVMVVSRDRQGSYADGARCRVALKYGKFVFRALLWHLKPTLGW